MDYRPLPLPPLAASQQEPVYEGARETLTALVQDSPKDREGRRHLGRLAIEHDLPAPADAKEAFEQARGAAPRDSEANGRRAGSA